MLFWTTPGNAWYKQPIPAEALVGPEGTGPHDVVLALERFWWFAWVLATFAVARAVGRSQ